MKTYAELLSFAVRYGIEHECIHLSKSYDGMKVQGEGMLPIKGNVSRGWMFGMKDVSGREGNGRGQWIWFLCLNGDALCGESVFFFEQRYSEAKNKAYRGLAERKAAYAAMNRRERREA